MDVPLSSENQQILFKLHRSTKEKRTADRIKTIILLNKDYTQKEIASILMLDEDTISRWVKKFKSSTNIKTWLGDNYVAYKGKLTPDEISQLKTYLSENIILNAKQVILYVNDNLFTNFLILLTLTLVSTSNASSFDSIISKEISFASKHEIISDFGKAICSLLSSNRYFIFSFLKLF